MVDIFQTPQINPEIFVEPTKYGTGFESTDKFIATRVALINDDLDTLKSLQVAQENVKQLDDKQLASYISGIVGKTVDKLSFESLDYHANAGAINAGAKDIAETQSIKSEESSVRQLALAAPKYLAQFEPNSYTREIARRDYTMMLVSKKMEEVGITPENWFDTTKGILGTVLPGRQLYQFGTSGDFSLRKSVETLFQMNDEDFFKAFPDVMDTVVEMSGNNPFIFMDRMKSYLDTDDLKSIYTFLALDAVDAATTVKAAGNLLKLAKFARAQNTPIKLLRDTGNAEKAAELNVAAMGDPAAAETLQTTMGDAASSASPFGGEGIDPNITNVIAPETQAIIAQRRADVQKALAPLDDQNFLIRRSAYTEAEIASANAKRLAQFAGDAKVVEQLEDGAVIEVSIQSPTVWPDVASIEKKITELEDTHRALKDMLANAKASPKGRKQSMALYQESLEETRDELVRYRDIRNRMADKAGDMGPVKPKTMEVRRVTVKYQNNDFGELEAIEYEKASKFLNSPSTHIDQQMPKYVENATMTDFSTAMVVKQFMEARNAIIKGLGRKSRKKLDSILLQGDRDQVVYSDTDLISGIRTPEGLIKFETAEELGAYRASRDMLDTAHELKNIELKRKLELGGFKAIHILVPESDGLNFVNPDKFLSNEELAGVKRIYNTDSESIVDVSVLKERPDSILNMKVYETKYPISVGDEIVNYVITRESRVKPLPRIVLAKRTGYVPKINKDVFYIAEMVGNKLVNGSVVPNYRTIVRYFDNVKDGREWTAAQNANGVRVDLRPSREWLDTTPGRREEFEAQIFGGLYGGKRAEREIPFGLEGTAAERLGGIEAMEAYMNHIASRLPSVNFRASLIQRFLNSAKDPDGISYLEDASNWRSKVRMDTPQKTRDGILAHQQWVMDQVRIPTTEERVWGNISQRMADYVSRAPGQAGSKLSKYAMKIGVDDLFTQLRGLSFHATLGWFNSSQFFVQAMGASLAMSIHPEKIAYMLPRSLALRASMFAKTDEAIKVIAKAALMNEDDFVRMVRAYQRTGLHESTLTTADYMAVQGLPDGPGAVKWLAGKGLIFFKEGERWARNYAWIQAYDEITKSGKLVKGGITDKMIDDVTRLHFRYTLNLNRANRAHWQKGVLAIPTQFYQISTKFMEAMLPRMINGNPNQWTAKEKFLVLGGQMALFGLAGIPFGRTMYDSLASYLSSDDEYGLAIKDEKVLTAMEGGLTELMMYNWTGERLDITNRLSIPAGIDTMMEMITNDQATAADLILGVSGEIGSRTWEATKANANILTAVMLEPETFDISVLRDSLDEIGKIMSSWRNYRKAQVWAAAGFVQDRYGNRLFEINDVDDRALLFAQAMGVAPKILDDLYAMKHTTKVKEEDIKETANAVYNLSMKYYKDPDVLVNVKKQRRIQGMINIFMWGMTDADKIKVLKQVKTKMDNEDYKLPMEMEKALDNMYNQQSAKGYQGNVELINDGAE